MKVSLTLQSGTIGQINRHAAIIKLKAEKSPAPARSHTIALADCSGSMSGVIDDVRRDLSKFVDNLGNEEFVSIIIFSGHGRAKLIIGPTRADDGGKKFIRQAIDREVRILDTTVFSEPLSLALETAKRHAGDDIAHNAILFTDGCAVPTRWSFEEEQRKALTVVKALRTAGVAVSVIGYGVYYDAEFIARVMAEAGGAGVYRHISEIEDFAEAIGEIREAFRRTRLANIELLITGAKGIGKILKTTPELVLAGSSGQISTRGLYNDEATFFIETSSPVSSIKVSGNVNGDSIDITLKAEKLSDDSAAEFVRVLGAYAFLTGDRETAAELLALVGDDVLADKAASSYTDRESREAGSIARSYFRDRKFIGAGLKPAGPNHCVLNVLRALIEDPETIVSLPAGAYKRSGLLKKDPRVVESPLGRTLDIKGYRSHNDRFNFSLLALKSVNVLPEGGGKPQPMQVWRTYNVILDGNLHTAELLASTSDKTFKLLQESGVIEDGAKYQRGKSYSLNLRNLRMISSNWANPRTLGLVSLLREEADLEAKQKALNARRKALGTPEKPDSEGGIYFEKGQDVEGLVVETYQAPCVTIELQGYKGKEFDASKLSFAEADAQVKEARQRLIQVRWLIRSIVFALDTVKSKVIAWGPEELNKRSGTKMQRFATFDGAQLRRQSWTEVCECS